MIAFEIELNGKTIALAGTDDLSVLTAIITAVGKLGPASNGATEYEDSYHCGLSVGGLTSRDDGNQDEHLDWVKEPVKLGDVVTIKFLEATSADAPTNAKLARTDDLFRQQFESAKKFYLENRDKFDGS